jgi:hypothetical protein
VILAELALVAPWMAWRLGFHGAILKHILTERAKTFFLSALKGLASFASDR